MNSNSVPAVIIPKEHQSAPKKDELDKAMETAAEEISSGKFRPQEEELPFRIALRSGIGEAGQMSGSVQDFIDTEASLDMSQHPAVMEAMAKLESQRDNARHSQEYLEKSQMLWELNENAKRKDKWQGQERWQGQENEESRIGLILSPMQFLERLERVIGKGRVMVCRWGQKDIGNPNTGRVALLVPRPKSENAFEIDLDSRTLPLLMEKRRMEQEFVSVRDVEKRKRTLARIKAIETQIEEVRNSHHGLMDEFKDFLQVGTLQWPCSSEWMVLNFDEYGVPTTAKYLGWRTALLSMIRLNVITEKEAHKAFPLGTGPASAWYRQQLYDWRHHHFALVQ